MKYQAVIFDLDGTILNTLDDLAAATNVVLTENGLPARTTDEVRRFVGNGIRKLIERAVPAGTDVATIDRLFARFKEYYGAHCADATRPYDGIPALLRRLRADGYRTAVVSNKADFAVKELCRDYFPDLFDSVAGEREGIRRKPAPDTVNAVLADFGLSPAKAVYVGDSDVDVETAKNAGMDCIGVAWGFRGETFLREHGATTVVSDAEELYRCISAGAAEKRPDGGT